MVESSSFERAVLPSALFLASAITTPSFITRPCFISKCRRVGISITPVGFVTGSNTSVNISLTVLFSILGRIPILLPGFSKDKPGCTLYRIFRTSSIIC